jgi:outer membrane protein
MLGFNLAAGVGAADTFRVAVIDPQAVLERSKSGKRALESLKAFSASRQRIVREEDEELKRLEKELQAGTSGEKDTVRKDKEEHFRAKLERYQRRVQAFNREIRDKQQELVQAFQKNIEHVAATVAAKAGYAAVLNKGALNSVRIVLYHRHAVDLTDEVLKEFDRLYS